MEREVGSAPYELPHKFEMPARGKEGIPLVCALCSQPETAMLHHAERVTETAADAGPALITEKGS